MYSQAVTHPSTNTAQCCLTSVIGRELVCSTWYGRRQEVGGKVGSTTSQWKVPSKKYGNTLVKLLCDTLRYRSLLCQGIARTQSPTNKNCALKLPTFGVIVGVSLTGVQWRGLTLEEPPSWSWFTSVPGKYAITRNWKTLFLWHKADFFWQETCTFLVSWTDVVIIGKVELWSYSWCRRSGWEFCISGLI